MAEGLSQMIVRHLWQDEAADLSGRMSVAHCCNKEKKYERRSGNHMASSFSAYQTTSNLSTCEKEVT